jgi:sialidase-1
VQVQNAHQKVAAEHGTVCSFPNDFFGYFGWPTVARTETGKLYVAASGLRNAHVCPFGRNVVLTSVDDGRTWATPTVANDSPLDDRDTGILSLGGEKVLISWFSTDTRRSPVYDTYRQSDDEEHVRRYSAGFSRMTDENAARWTGSWVRASEDGGESWGRPVRVQVTAPHGPIRLSSGALLYLGKEFMTDSAGHRQGVGQIRAITSQDGGATWWSLGTVPLYEGTVVGHYHEPHVVELADGKLLGLIRFQNHGDDPRVEDLGLVHFSLMQTMSQDRGRTWTPVQPLGFHGSPPHLMVHSSGTLACVYGYRLVPYGQRAMVSYDGGETWLHDLVLRDDGPDSDLGYPSSVELADGSVLTVYYQKAASARTKCGILWTRWELPRAR